jgi:hypothetical protein
MSLFVERRRPPLSPDLLVRVAIAWAMIAALLLVTNLPAMLAHRFPDPDDTLRMVQVRDLIAGQGWFDLTQHRIDAIGGGVPMHWSRLVDLPLAAVILLLRGLIGQDAAETAALIIVPLLTFACALLLAARIAWRVIGEEAAGFACLAMALSVPLVQQMRPMRIDHHGWQIVLVLAAMNGLMARSPRHGGWAIGAALAAGLAISIEGLPLAAAICGIVALRWLRDRHDAQWFAATMQGLAIGSLVLFAATRGFADVIEHCDAISPAHIAAFGVVALMASGLARFEPMPRFALVAGLAATAAVGLATFLSFAPNCAGGPFAQLDPVVARFWYDSVGEGLPVWKQDIALVLQIVVPPLVGLVACVRLAGRTSDWLLRFWQEYALVLAAALAISLFVARAGAVAGALAAVPLGWQVREWLRASRTLRRKTKKVLALAAVALVLLPALPLTLFALAIPAQASVVARAASSNCAIPDNAGVLRALPRGEVLAPLDIGPQLIYETRHTVVATGHHRGQDAMRTVIETFTGSPEAARATLSARGTRYIALCPDLIEPGRYKDAAAGGFMADLLEGRAPGWLEPVQVRHDGSLEVWRIRD